MLVLGLDPSLRAFGHCTYNSEATPKRRIVDSGHEGTVISTVQVARFMHFRAMVENILSMHKIEAVGIESPAYSGGPFSETHFGLMLFCLEAVFKRRIDCVLFDPETLKYLVKEDPKLRKGKLGKIDVQRYVANDTDTSKLIDDNEADAYCIAKFSSRMINFSNGKIPPEELTPSEFSVFLGRTKTKKILGEKKIVKRTAHIFRENSRFFRFSKIPEGRIDLPKKEDINSDLLKFLENIKEIKNTNPSEL
jgi:Holliday junction resolvasome RuvABC endonuclease subunit